jgi:hypothetical protein
MPKRMKPWIINAVLRSFRRIVLSFVLVLFVLPATAQENLFVGTWSGYFSGVTLTFALSPDFRYSEQNVAGSMQTSESGNYRLSPQDVIIFQVEDWYPKTQSVYHPTGTVGGYYSQEPVPRPPGGTYHYIFTSANSVTLTDLNTQASVTLMRMQ